MALDNNHITRLGELKSLIDGVWTKVKALVANFIDDAPSDGNEYVRKNGNWEVVSGGADDSWFLAIPTETTYTELANAFAAGKSFKIVPEESASNAAPIAAIFEKNNNTITIIYQISTTLFGYMVSNTSDSRNGWSEVIELDIADNLSNLIIARCENIFVKDVEGTGQFARTQYGWESVNLDAKILNVNTSSWTGAVDYTVTGCPGYIVDFGSIPSGVTSLSLKVWGVNTVILDMIVPSTLTEIKITDGMYKDLKFAEGPELLLGEHKRLQFGICNKLVRYDEFAV